MPTPRLALAMLAIALPVAAGALLAQDAPPRSGVLTDAATIESMRPTISLPQRDPFRGPPALEGPRATGLGPAGAVPSRPRLPALRLLAVVEIRGRAPAALLEVDRAVCVVRSGDRLSIEVPGFAPAELLVQEVARGRLRLSFDGELREVR